MARDVVTATLIVSLAAMVPGGIGSAVGQQSPAPAQAPEGRTAVFEPDFFASYNPVTAEDMVRRIPGFSLVDGLDRRGFAGASGNVLINGERPTSKNPLSEQLSRIAARDVLRIDLYASGMGGGDVGGQALYVDVRLRPRGAQATNTFVAQVSRLDPSGSLNPVINATSAFKAGDVTYNLSLNAQPARRGRIEFDRRLTTPSGTVIEQGPELLQGSYFEYRFTGRASVNLSEQDRLTLSAQVAPSRDGRHTFSEVRSATDQLIRVDDSSVEGDDALASEFGADWERKLGEGATFKAIALSSARSTGSSERFSTTNGVTGARRDTLIERSIDSGESILRGVLSWKPAPGHALEMSAEGALNFLDSNLDVQVRSGSTITNATPPVANTRVEETRGELAVTDLWSPGGGVTLEAGLRVETSRISQSGDANQERTFTFWKPRLRATWDPAGPDQFRLLLDRDVAQLDFSEFASSVSIFDGNQFIGNPDLEPERTWRLQFDWERKLMDKGVAVLTLFRDDVEAVQDRIPIGSLDGPGNIGDGWRTGLRVDATLPLGGVGLTGAELRLKGFAQKTSVTDPTTLTSRRFSDEADWSYSVDYRHALPGRKALLGFVVEQTGPFESFLQKEFRHNEWLDPGVELFAESTAFKGLVVRVSLQDALRPVELRERRFFAPDRSNPAQLSRIEKRFATGAFGTRSFVVRVAGRF